LIALTPAGWATVLAALVVIVALSAARARAQRHAEALRARRRGEQTAEVRRLVADVVEACEARAFRLREWR
jgi:hypothetical protein